VVLGTEPLIKSNIWATIYPQKSIDVFKGNKQENTVNLLGTLSLIGNSNTTDITTFIYPHKFPKSSEEKSYEFPRDTTDMKITDLKLTHLDSLRNNLNLLLKGRLTLTHSGKKIVDDDGNFKRYPSPVDLKYVIITNTPKNDKGKSINQYFLTLKGFFLVMGYDLTSSEFKSVIENASKISLFFCFIKTVMYSTSIDFVIEIFIKPIRQVLLRSDIFQGGNMDFYFGNFADVISSALSKKMTLIDKTNKKNIGKKPVSYFYKQITFEYRRQYPYASTEDLISFKMNDAEDDLVPLFKKNGIESLMDNVFYYENQKEDLYESITEHFYTPSELKSSFLDFGYDFERLLVGKVMQSIHFTYYSLLGQPIPKIPRKKLLRSKGWKRHQKYKRKGSKFKPMKEYDISNL